MPVNARHAVRTVGLLTAVALGGGLLTAVAAAPIVGLAGVATKHTAQTFNDLKVPKLGQLPTRSEIVDRKGHLIAYYYPNNQYRIPVSFDQISPYMRQAIVAIEDARFWQHGAFDPRGTIRALISTVSGKQTQGGSDLAQQYVKNALILAARTNAQRVAASAETVTRKIRELRMAAIVEHQLTKPQLLSAYLNAAFFGNASIGIQVAARTYFSTSAARLTLTQAALLAGVVEAPSRYDPIKNSKEALARRNEVLTRMQQLGRISKAAAHRAAAAPLGLHVSRKPIRQGCGTYSGKYAAWFCDYVLAVMAHDRAYRQAYHELTLGAGGLTIHTTMSPQDQSAAQSAVNYEVPPPPSYVNPAGNAAAEVLVQPGTGYVRAIAVDRRYGVGHSFVNYAVDSQYHGGFGVQTGSSSKLFTLLTALKQGLPFGYQLKVKSGAYVYGFHSCKGEYVGRYQVFNADRGGENGTYTLYNGTTLSVNAYYANLEQRVGLCNVVKTAASLGLRRFDGKSLFVTDRTPLSVQEPADGLASFTLGSVNVSPMSMAGAYATVAARGIYCHPIAIRSIVTTSGRRLPVESAHCHRVLSTAVADAANYILQGVMQSGTGAPDAIPGLPEAGKTGTANGAIYVAFAGYTPRLAGYVSMFNPVGPQKYPMVGYPGSCYRAGCVGFMFGANAGNIWQLTFEHANLGSPPAQFVSVPPTSPFFSQGSGNVAPIPLHPPKKPKKPKKPKPPGHP
jgi:membrane peptidoglycan carboxypeptidase